MKLIYFAFAILLYFYIELNIECFYLPGVAPVQYHDGDPIQLKVLKLYSTRTQLPFDYYYLPFCQPEKIIKGSENLGEMLLGDVIQNSPYDIKMNQKKHCEILCKKKFSRDDLKRFDSMIRDKYYVYQLLDNFPAVTKYYTTPIEGETPEENGFVSRYERGFLAGFTRSDFMINQQANDLEKEDKKAYINNHININVLIHKVSEKLGQRVVGFEVAASSAHHSSENDLQCQSNQYSIPQEIPYSENDSSSSEPVEIIFTYDVKFTESPNRWASRQDTYLKMTDSKIHWFSITNSLIVVLFLFGFVALIIIRALRKDFSRYNTLQENLEMQREETGQKLVHGDVFRPPKYGSLYSVFIGTGFQVFAMFSLTLFFALLGFLSPANRGGLMTALLVLFVLMGMVAGYVSARTYKMLGLKHQRRNTFYTAILYPGINFCVFLILNIFVSWQQASNAVSFSVLFLLLLLQLGISFPLVYLGAYYGYKEPAISSITNVNLIPRQIPEQNWYMQPFNVILMSGILPFGAIFIELFFILSSIWLDRFYYMFGFIFLVFLILIITCAEITIVTTYFQLCSEDYEWQQRSFFVSGSSAFYLFAYSAIYFFTKLEIVKFVSGLLYFGYMFLISLAFFLLTGTIGAVASFLFIRKIYSSIKID